MDRLLPIVFGTLFLLPLLVGLGAVFYYLFSLPMRRRERTRLLLDAMEVGLQQGRSPEQTLHGLAQSGDRALGKRFLRLGGVFAGGLPLKHVFETAPEIFPAPVAGMLTAGLEIGALGKVFPACRTFLRDAVSSVWNAQHYLVLLGFVLTPAWMFVFLAMAVFVFPKFQAIAQDMGAEVPAMMTWMCAHAGPLVAVQAGLMLVFYGAVFAYVCAPFSNALRELMPDWADWLMMHTPWRRTRMHRDFVTLLGLLLDHDVPEPRAVRLAAACTGNVVYAGRAERVVAQLEQGVRLTDALGGLDETGQLRWRLANAARARGRFASTLAGWQEALQARAFQQEQTVAQLVTTGLVLLNGLWVALLAVSVFKMLTGIVWACALW